MKTAIIVGHNERAQGAVRVTDGRTEYDWNGQLAELIHEIDPRRTKIFYRTSGGGYRAQIKRVYAEADEWGADQTLELHFNGGPRSARGCETLSSGTAGSMALAHAIQAAILAELPVVDRGVKVRERHERGGGSLWAGPAPAVLLEPYFGSNERDCHMADDYMEILAEAILDGATVA